MWQAFNIPYLHNFTTQLCRRKAKVLQDHTSATGRNTGKDEAMHRKQNRLELGGGQAYDRSSD
jgi:hypothetical protein